MWGRWRQFDDDSAFGLAISDKGGLCRVFSPAAPIFVVQGTVVGTARQNISMVGCCRLPLGTSSRSVRVLLKVPYLHYFSPLPRPRWKRKPVLSLCPSLCPRADLKALSGGQDQLHRLTSLLAHRGGLHQGKAHWLDLPLQPLPPCIKTTGRLLRSPHRTPLPSSHFAADGQSARPSASFAPPPALGCSCHHYAPVNSLRASGVHRMLTANRGGQFHA